MRLAVVTAIVLSGALPTAEAQEVIGFDRAGEHMVLTPHMGWYKEPGEALGPQEAAARYHSGAFHAFDGEWAELGVMAATVWLAVSVKNQTNAEYLIVEFRNPRMSYVDCFVPNGSGGYFEMQNGSVRPFSLRTLQHPMPSFPLRLGPGEERLVLLRLENVGDFRFRVWLWEARDFFNRISSAYIPEYVTIGVLLVLAVFHLLVFLSLWELAYLHLSLFIFAWLLFFMSGNGTGSMLIWSDMPWLALRANTLSMILMCITFVFFTMSFLRSHRYTPLLYRVGLIFVGLCFLDLLHCCLTDSVWRIPINRWVSLATLLLVGVLAIQAIRQGSRMAWFFLATWVMVLAGAAIMVLLSWYMVSSQLVMGTSLINFLYTSSIMLWSFELTGRIKVRARKQRELLEVQVNERTAELEQALGEVKTLSGLLPICSSCKNIRDDQGYWKSVEHYLILHTDAGFTHGICPDCFSRLYPDFVQRREGDGDAAVESAI
ncbi:MAG: hypothetical protein HYV27_04325 [Candidatus Hydrogenedentes bacterium]|nr:hypothetical protein [Candidatus Hydrogenedentota bacterium]